MKPIKLKPAFKDYIWGGTRLRDEYKMDSELTPLAEAWVLSCHKDGNSTVIGGKYDGLTLMEAIEKMGRKALGTNGQKFEFFPVLIKLIDAKGNLSIQVHPSDEYALKNEGQYGKTEMWYVVDCEPGAYLYYGFNREISKEEFKERIENNTLLEVLNKCETKKGDCFFIESGTIHAIGAGLLIAEIQQNSNLTYRVYDYGRVGADLKPRELHIEKAQKVTKLSKPTHKILHTGDCNGDTLLASCPYFTATDLKLEGEKEITVDEKSFVSLLIVKGKCTVDGEKAVAGDSFFLPASYGKVKISGKAEILESRV